MHRTIATHLAVLMAGCALGLGAVAVAGQPVAHSSASDSRIVSKLTAIDKKLDAINKTFGGDILGAGHPRIKQLLQQICKNTGQYDTGCL